MKTVGIIVEWDNVRLSDIERALRMLARLQRQACSIASHSDYIFDLLLIHDPEATAAEMPAKSIAQCINAEAWPGKVRVIEAPGLTYYDQKNFGVRHTDADPIIFVDSDVVPDDGWLAQMLEALEDESVRVVGGETYLATDTFYQRLCAGFWIFDVRRPGTGLQEAHQFYANNVAMRREIVERFPFPHGETFRGQCVQLAKDLHASGVTLYRARSAAVSHPPPDGLRHFVHRAICHGHDTLLNQTSRRRGVLARSPLGSVLRFLRRVVKAPAVIWRRRRQARLGLLGMLMAFGLSIVYFTLMLTGELATFVSPGLVRRWFSI